ncbi:hypothetical protein QI633_07855 [Nocardioides sp. QY071]|uniref:phage terminase small subunit n=1 Tax=Nocardioides sp. QY071 TaxID=3044187 RepID=UPI00249CD898|nr:hypothetical protein [Nocardioides sp. QY071]WGY03670.1 hypothetical protein QI633_07855 [Nocardioides sp. QY071]
MPNRSGELTPAAERQRKSRGTTAVRGKSNPATIPDPDPDWCHAARLMWDSACESGGAAFYESSDYATLWLLCDQIDYLYRTNKDGEAKPRSPEMFKAVLTGLGNLLVSEGDRRKLHIELEKAPDDNPDFLNDLNELLDN